MAFVPAQKTPETVTIKGFIQGFPGSGKTFTALLIASFLALLDENEEGAREVYQEGADLPFGFRFKNLENRVALIESENRGREYADPFSFSIEELSSFSPGEWIKALQEAKIRGFKTVILDSVSDEWKGAGGCLEMVSNLGGKYSDWNPVKREHWKFFDAILAYPGNVFCTLRLKEGIEIDAQRKASKSVDTVQEEEIAYRLSHVWEIAKNSNNQTLLKVLKSVIPQAPAGLIEINPGRKFAELLKNGLGVSVETPCSKIKNKIDKAKTENDLKDCALSIDQNLHLLTQREIVNLRFMINAKTVNLKGSENGTKNSNILLDNANKPKPTSIF